MTNGKLVGTILGSNAIAYPFDGSRAPKLIRKEAIKFGKEKPLFNGESLNGWHQANENKKNQSYEPYPYQLSSLGFSPKFFRSIIQANRYNNY